MTKHIKITDMSGAETEVVCDDASSLMVGIKEQMGLSIDCFDLFHDDIHVTKSQKQMESFELEDKMELMIIKSDKPIRILDETVIRDQEAYIPDWDIKYWDIKNMEKKFGPIEEWDVSFVSNMCYVFRNASSFNQDISGWDVSNVTCMSGMFSSASFNQDISGWDVSNVNDMSCMFGNATSFEYHKARFYDFKRNNKRATKLTMEEELRVQYTRRSFTKAKLYEKLISYGIKYKTRMKKNRVG
jgi:surface protein